MVVKIDSGVGELDRRTPHIFRFDPPQNTSGERTTWEWEERNSNIDAKQTLKKSLRIVGLVLDEGNGVVFERNGVVEHIESRVDFYRMGARPCESLRFGE